MNPQNRQPKSDLSQPTQTTKKPQSSPFPSMKQTLETLQ